MSVSKILYPCVFAFTCAMSWSTVSLQAVKKNTSKFDKQVHEGNEWFVQDVADVVTPVVMDDVAEVESIKAVEEISLSDAATDNAPVEIVAEDLKDVVTISEELVVADVATPAVMDDNAPDLLRLPKDFTREDADGAVNDADDSDIDFVADVPVAIYDVAAEKIKWAYVSEKFVSQEAELAGFSNNVGSFLNDYAPLISSLVIPPVFLVSMEKLPSKMQKISRNPLVAMGASMALSVTTGAIANSLCKATGRWLHAKPAMCQTILQTFVAEWDEHKAKIPQALHHMFDALSQDLQLNGAFTIIDQDQALLIVDCVLAAAAVATIL